MRRYHAGYFWSALSVALCTGVFWLAHAWVDKGDASLLYLPVVIACSIYFGFGPAVLAAVLSFLCWDYFFLPPFRTFIIADPKDWLSLVVFLIAAITTAHLASRARDKASQARAREAEIAVLFDASETLSRELGAQRVISVLSDQVRTLCRASECVVWRTARGTGSHPRLLPIGSGAENAPSEAQLELAAAAVEHNQVIGFDKIGVTLWDKALGQPARRPAGVFVPLQAENRIVGVLHVGVRQDSRPFSALDQRLILTLANHAAVVIARESLAEEAAQAEALRETDLLKDSLL